MDLITPDIGLLFWMLLSFSIVLVILKKYAWKPILGALKDREDSIESALSEARKAIESLPDNFSHTKFLEFLFLTVEHYNDYWYKKLQQENIWSELSSNLPK